MSTESFNRTSDVVETPRRVDVDVLKQRLLEEQKKEKTKRTVIIYSILISLGALTMLSY